MRFLRIRSPVRDFLSERTVRNEMFSCVSDSCRRDCSFCPIDDILREERESDRSRRYQRKYHDVLRLDGEKYREIGDFRRKNNVLRYQRKGDRPLLLFREYDDLLWPDGESCRS